MYRSLTPVLLLFSIWVAGCNVFDGNNSTVNRNDRKAQASFSYEIDLVNQLTFQIEAINGSININGAPDSDLLKVSGIKTVGSESIEDAEKHLDDLSVEVTETDNEIFVETIQPNNSRGRSYTVDYDISLPDNLRSIVLQVNGTISIEGIRANLEAELVNGDIELEDIRANTKVSVVNGSIESDIIMPLGGSLEQRIVNGTIDLTLPDTTSAMFSAEISNGDIVLSGLNLTDQNVTTRRVSGTMGDGNGSISLRVTNGEIQVTGRN